MKVKCTRIVNAAGRTVAPGESPWLTPGKTYLVLAISIVPEGVRYRIIADQPDTPALFPADQFEVVDGVLGSAWVFSIRAAGIEIGPGRWSAPDFWERYFDGDPQAIEAFRIAREE